MTETKLRKKDGSTKTTIPVKSTSEIDMTKLSREELVQHIQLLEDQVTNLNNKIELQLGQNGPKRKYQVLDLLKQGPMTISEMAAQLGISNANISSQLTYLRQQDGIKIYTDDAKRKFLA